MDQLTQIFIDLGQKVAKSDILVKQYTPSIKNATKAILAGYTSYLIVSWHDQYGTVVRIGPNTISISDKNMIKQALITESLPKAPSYETHKGRDKCTVNIIDNTEHKFRRRLLMPGFSNKYVANLEESMNSGIKKLVRKIDSEIAAAPKVDSYGTVDIFHLIKCTAIDMVCEICFDSSVDVLENDPYSVRKTIDVFLEATAKLISHPLVGPLLAIMSIGQFTRQLYRLKKVLKMPRQLVVGAVIKRQNGETERRNDILQYVLDTQKACDPQDRLSMGDIILEMTQFLIAGSETTATTISFVFIQLLQNPETLDRLQKELDAATFDEGSSAFRHQELKDLPYLNAVINETMRLNHILICGVERQAHKDFVLGGRFFVPKGTLVTMNLQHAQTNPEYWPEPLRFMPERWLEKKAVDEEAFYPFSLGSRNCLAKFFALQEMRLLIATVLKFFDIESIPQEMENAKDRRQFVTLTLASQKFRVNIRRRQNA
ncbi:cytochrome P450 [Syncephalastrum racemosum]|uniref:Cytochrome P450 n=1 Tax=Syncephalastrum racemosum TaxID=13706 RepID=A0A1X2HSD8_SYNRA|nr:cytochrome P450 [Syncephalastrum racemosum]